MHLRVIKGLAEARKETWRVDPADVDSLPQSIEDRTVETFGEKLSPVRVVERILDDVRRKGDDAVRHYAHILDGAPPGRRGRWRSRPSKWPGRGSTSPPSW